MDDDGDAYSLVLYGVKLSIVKVSLSEKTIDEVSEGGSTPIYYPHVCDTEPPRMLLNSENNSLFHLYPFLSSLPFIFSLLLYGTN